jgi:hypothetical protein
MSNVKELIKAAKKKHAAEIKEIREQAAREEEQLLVHVARLMEQHEPERFAQYRQRAASLIEQEREQERREQEQQRAARSARAKAARARRKEQPEAVHDDGGEAQ